jgi:pimeloyl-ACP methyl ester carboxylesterase
MKTLTEIQNRLGEPIDQTFHPGIRGEALIVMGHGVTGDKDRPLLVALAEGLSEQGWPCLRISFTGHGESGGRFEESCISKEVADLQDLLDTVPDDVAVVYLGHSMGAAVGVLTAARDLRIRGLISVAGMTYTAAFLDREFSEIKPGEGLMWGDRKFPLSQIFADDLRLIDHTLLAAETVSQPWLVIHGGADDVVPLQDGRDVFDAAVGEKEWLEIPDAGHSFDERSYPIIVNAVDQWLETCFGPG